ncbi:MAG: hypothetical protein M0C28_48365 [Candidatus Moduliflexus flocculans]|nr:hypothetical protein [Candidatus Moduliflexus flocculans]
MSLFAYTIYGVAITPALIAALAWKRVTKAGGLASIISGTVVCLVFFVAVQDLPRHPGPRRRSLGHPAHLPGPHRLARRPGHRQPADAEVQAGGAGEVLPEDGKEEGGHVRSGT